MKKTTLLILMALIGISFQTKAQKQGYAFLDSLNNELAKAKEDSNKVNLLNKLSRELWQSGDYAKAKQDADDALALSEKIGFKRGKASAYNNIGIIYINRSNYPDALKNQILCLKIKEEIGDKNGIASSYGNIGNICKLQGNYPDALKNYFHCLKIMEVIGNTEGMARSYTCIGLIYQEQGNYPDALKNNFAALKIFEDFKNKNGISDIYNNIALIYHEQGNYNDALKNNLASLKIKEDIGDKKGIANSYVNIGIIYQEQGNYPDALKNYLAGLEIRKEIGDKDGIANTYNNLGDVNIKLKQYTKAKKYLDSALTVSKEIGSKRQIKYSYAGLTSLDSACANWKDAYLHHQLFILYRDSLVNEENTTKTVQTQMQYEFDKKELAAKAIQDKKDIKQRNVRNSIAGALLSALIVLLVVFRQRNKIRKEKKRSDDLLLNILPAEVANELKETGAAAAKQYNHVSVLFTDFVNFTGISEQLSPTELVSEIHKNFTAFDAIIQKNGLEKIKTIGDAYMAVCGLPNVTTEHAQRVVRAAIEIRDYVALSKGKFHIRIGVNSGPVVAGIVGVKKYAYDIWGDTVNTASRMESNSETDKVNISGTTYALVKDEFTCTYRGKISVKGKGEVDMYFVES